MNDTQFTECPIHGKVDPSHRCSGNELGAIIPRELPQYEAGVVEALEETIEQIKAGKVFDRGPTSRDIGDE